MRDVTISDCGAGMVVEGGEVHGEKVRISNSRETAVRATKGAKLKIRDLRID
jgi:hypothetical protein